jgi:adenosylhomocysteinase
VLQAAMDGFEVKKLNTVVGNADIIITTTGNKDIVLGSHFEQMIKLSFVLDILITKIGCLVKHKPWSI